MTAAEDLVLVVDGSFLQRDLTWDEVVFVDTAFEVARDRGARRDADMFGGVDQAGRAFDVRYHAACRRYLAEADPLASATIVVGNDDPEHPVLRRIGGAADAKVRLFSYGTLQLPAVQAEHFGRHLAGEPDVLPGFRQEWDKTPGTVLTLTTTELAAADLYEVDDYRRTLVRLASGTDAWVYLAASGKRPNP